MNKKAIISALLITFMLIIPMTAWAIGTISGTVTEQATTSPVSGIVVRLLDNMANQLGQTTTDGSGAYTFASVADGSGYQVNARGNTSYASQILPNVVVTNGNTTTVDFALLPGGTIKGTVFDNANGSPIAGIQLLVFDSSWVQYRTLTTSATGTYTINGLPVRSDYRIAAVGNSTYAGQWQSPITVTPGVPVEVNYSLLHSGTIAGTVTDSTTGSPVAGISVDVYVNGWPCSPGVVTDVNGQYMIVGLQELSGYSVQTQGDATYPGQGQGGVSVTVGNTTTVNFSLSPLMPGLVIPTATITVDGDAADWAGILPLAIDPQNDAIAYFSAYAGSDIQAIYAAKDATNLYVRVDLWGNANTNFGNWPNAPYEGDYRMYITSNSGMYPTVYLSWAYYWQSQWSIYSNDNGPSPMAVPSLAGPGNIGVNGNVMELKVPLADIGAPTSFFSIFAHVNNCCSNPSTLTLDESTITSLGAISGIVTASDTSLPIEGLQVFAYGGSWPNDISSMTDATGRYTLSGLSAGSSFQVQVQGNGTYAGQTQSGISTAFGSITTVNFSLSAPGAIAGTVTASGSGTPIEGLWINVNDSNWQGYGWAQTDASGNYTVTGLPARTDYRVQVQGNSTYAGQTQTNVSVISGATTTVNFSLSAAGTIAGTVTASGGGLPISGLQVDINDSNWQYYGGAQTDTSGNYTVTGLPARTDYRVRVQGNVTYAGQTQTDIAVVSGNTTTVDFSLVPGGSIAGTVRDAVTSFGIGNIYVSVIDELSGWVWIGGATTNFDGTYRIDGLPQGSWMVNTSSQGQSWYVGQTYNGVIRSDMATLVAVVSGNTTTGINFNLVKGGTISGIVTTSTGSPIANAEVNAVMPDGSEVSWVKTDGTGAYMLGPVSPGVTIMARAPGTSYVGQYYGGGISLSSAATVTVVIEANTSGIDIALPVGSLLTGTITMDGGAAQDAWISLYSVTDGKWMFDSTLSGQVIDPVLGTWSVAVPAGTYKLWGAVQIGGIELPSMYYDSTHVFDSATDVVPTGTGTVANLNFAFSSLYGSVTGTVSYSGTQAGEVIEWTSPAAGNDWPKMSAGNGGPLGAYTLLSTAGTWYVKAFMDVNNNMLYDAGEPFGEYAGGAVVVTNANTVSGVDIVLADGGAPVPVIAPITWYNTGTGQVYVQTTDGSTVTGGSIIHTEPDTAWSIVGQGDFNGDSVRDYVWRNSVTGQVYLMFMTNSTTVGSGAVVWTETDPNWRIVATGDLNGDGRTDLVWWNSSTGMVFALLINGSTVVGSGVVWTEPDTTNWRIVAAGDINGDGKADLVWWNSSTGMVFGTIMNGTSVSSSGVIWTEPTVSEWRIAGMGDLDGDGKSDLVWRSRSNGMVFAMLLNGTSVSSSGVPWTEADLNWEIVDVDNYTLDNKADLLWRNKTSGMVFLVPMNGLSTASGGSVLWTEPSAAWRIEGAIEWKSNAYGVGVVTP